MKVSVFGLGYVGSVSAACLASKGHKVIGVDVNEQKLAMIKSGESPVIEPGLDELVRHTVANGHLRVTSDAVLAVMESDLSLVCVGTPTRANGGLDLDVVREVSRQIGAAIGRKVDYHCVVVRSTVLPGTIRETALPLLERSSGKSADEGFGVVMNPEFLREGSAISDFQTPSYTVIGSRDGRAASTAAKLYADVDAPIIHTDLETAEMVKYAANAFHALKVTFANEIGALAKQHGVDGRETMEILCRDERLNISRAYLRPGFAFGGSCLPKDLRALTHRARHVDVTAPLLEAVTASNEAHLYRGLALIEAAGSRSVGVLGLTFKPGTDDVRESPVVAIVETLLGKGYDISVFDDQLALSRLMGKNKSFLEHEIPHIASLMRRDVDEVLKSCDIIVVGNNNSAFADIGNRLRPDQLLIDLAGVVSHAAIDRGSYEGICW